MDFGVFGMTPPRHFQKTRSRVVLSDDVLRLESAESA
jgi:hypothetical protein